MGQIKILAGQTAVYGLSSIIGRILNYLLVPLYTRIFIPSEYGIVNEMYAYVSFLIVILTYGMETAYFRFSEISDDKEKVYSSCLISILITTFIFIILTSIFSHPLARLIKYPDNTEYVIWFSLIISIDAITAIPFARLRAEYKAKQFALYKLFNIILNIFLNIFFLIICPYLQKKGIFPSLINLVYSKKIGVGYIFISNLIANVVTLLLISKYIILPRYDFDKDLWKKMIKYALPLLIVGIAGSINEVIDRILLKYLLPEKIAMTQLGIYGACYKISILMTIVIQAFRFAAEPFFFKQAKEKNAKAIYATVMKYFVIVCASIFLAIMLYIDIVKYFVGERYHEGLKVVPILLLANLFLGIYYNLSIWYKLTGQTKYGAYISSTGALITIILNLWWIPIFGYMGSAWATFFCYAIMMILSYIYGQKHYYIKYNLKKIFLYLFLAIAFFLFANHFLNIQNLFLKLFINSIIMFSYLAIIYFFEKEKFYELKNSDK